MVSRRMKRIIWLKWLKKMVSYYACIYSETCLQGTSQCLIIKVSLHDRFLNMGEIRHYFPKLSWLTFFDGTWPSVCRDTFKMWGYYAHRMYWTSWYPIVSLHDRCPFILLYHWTKCLVIIIVFASSPLWRPFVDPHDVNTLIRKNIYWFFIIFYMYIGLFDYISYIYNLLFNFDTPQSARNTAIAGNWLF